MEWYILLPNRQEISAIMCQILKHTQKPMSATASFCQPASTDISQDHEEKKLILAKVGGANP